VREEHESAFAILIIWKCSCKPMKMSQRIGPCESTLTQLHSSLGCIEVVKSLERHVETSDCFEDEWQECSSERLSELHQMYKTRTTKSRELLSVQEQ